jgi:hypothetical protein
MGNTVLKAKPKSHRDEMSKFSTTQPLPNEITYNFISFRTQLSIVRRVLSP